METISPEKDSYIEKVLSETFSDRLFKTNINGNEGYIYLLFEHKSYQSPGTALQLLKYMVNIWEQKYNKQDTGHLPVIIPLVVYHGESTWKAGHTLSAMLKDTDKLPAGLEKLESEHTEKDHDFYETIILYIINTRQDIAIEDLAEAAKSISPERSEQVMSLAEQLVNEGMEKGIEKGIVKYTGLTKEELKKLETDY